MHVDQITWVIKASKFCNMRCSYCYEWDDLGNRDRMSTELLASVFAAVRGLHAIRRESAPRGVRVVSSLVLHGGEPLILPVEYLRRFFSLASQVFGGSALASGEIRFGAQSNLLAWRDEVVEMLIENRVSLGVSYDVVPGVRRLLSGARTEERVVENIDRIRALGIPVGGIAVLARHTAPRITGVYDFFAGRGMSVRVLPLFDGPASRPAEDFAIGDESLVSALLVLFRHWVDTGATVQVEPLTQWLGNVLRRMLGVRGPLYDRRSRGDSVLIVDTDGKLYGARDAYDVERSLGDLSTHTIEGILAAPAYAASLERDRELLERSCAECLYAGACDGSPVSHTAIGARRSSRCPVALGCHEGIEQYLRDSGCDAEALRAMLVAQPDVAEAGGSQAVALAG
jgi:uncharacterized protein